MRVNNLRKIAYISIMVLVLLTNSLYLVYAETEQELRDKQTNLDQKIKETSSEIAGVKSKMTETLGQINKLNTQIGTYENEIEQLTSKIDVLNGQIEEKEISIKEQEQKYEDQNDLLCKRLVVLYESGTTTFLDMLLSSEGLTDFISKYYLITQLAEYDVDLLKAIEETKNTIEKEKNELESDKKEVVSAKETIQVRKNTLDISVKEKGKLVNTLTAEEKTLQEQLDQFEKDKRAIQSELAAILRDKGGSVWTYMPESEHGFISPIPGRTKANITTGYYGYSGHTGVDFACSSGTTIVSTKSGVVVKSEALTWPNGSYRSYGEYIVVLHSDGMMTLYAHGLPGSRMVSLGDAVVQGQQIMRVGSTGNSTGPHLHFEILIGGNPVNPTPYLP